MAIAKKTMGAYRQGQPKPCTTCTSCPSRSRRDLRINEKYMQQFVENQKKSGAENVPSRRDEIRR